MNVIIKTANGNLINLWFYLNTMEGILHLKTEPMTTPQTCWNTVGNCGSIPTNALPMIEVKASGVTSKYQFPKFIGGSGDYILYETRVKLPKEDETMWPSFWISDSGGEIDIFEYYKDHISTAIIHNGTKAFCQYQYYPPSNISLSDDYHTFSVLWNNDHSQTKTFYFFMDGIKIGSQNTITIPDGVTMRMRMDNKVNNRDHPTGQVSNEMLVDYVKIWKLNDVDKFFEAQNIPAFWETNVHSNEYSVSIAPDVNKVFFRGTDNRVHIKYINHNGNWQHGSLTPINNTNEKIGGDIIAETPQSVIYVGLDNKLHNYSWQGGWAHSWLQDANGNTLTVHNVDGAFDIDNDGNIAYINTSKDIVYLKKLGHLSYAPPTILSTPLHKAMGEVKITEEKIFYKGEKTYQEVEGKKGGKKFTTSVVTKIK